MFLEKHWFTLLLSAVLIVMAANAKAETATNGVIEKTQYMFDRVNSGTGVPDVDRMYDYEADVVCYQFSSATNVSCSPNNSMLLRRKYERTRIELKEKYMKEAGL